jgi:hypothetical protein
MRSGLVLAAAAASAAVAAPASAQVSGTVTVTGNVTEAICYAGELSDGSDSFELGVLSENATGLLRDDLAAAPKTLTGAFCTAQSVLTISATPMVALNNPGTPPGGFSRAVHYTATASGWTPTPASFTTGSATNPNASQSQPQPFQGDIVVAIDDFSTDGGANRRLVIDDAYQGIITLTLAAAN